MKKIILSCVFISSFVIIIITSTLAFAAPVIINNINIETLERSQKRVILRELPFSLGDLWQPEFALIAERRLRNLGLYDDVIVSPPDMAGIVHIKLNPRWSFWVLPVASRSDTGASSAGIQLTEHNLWGLHHYLRLGVREDTGRNFSSANGTWYYGSYLWRRINDGLWDVSISGRGGSSIYDAYLNGLNVGQYDLRERTWQFMLWHHFTAVSNEGWQLGFGMRQSQQQYLPQSGVKLADVQDTHSNSLLWQLNFIQLNDFITWQTGEQFNYSLEISRRNLGSNHSLLRQQISYNKHIALATEHTLDWRIAAGHESGDVLHDRLFDLGNRDVIRGYYPGDIQGTAYLYGTLETRRNFKRWNNVQAVAFSDMGLVWNKTNNKPILFPSAGAGLRWTLRWLVNGTARMDAAYGWRNKRWRIHFGARQAF
ncbi:MAG: BamA/TamA family outer membrane protein [Mariprofundales bacterium]